MKITAPFKLIAPHDLTTDGGITRPSAKNVFDSTGALVTVPANQVAISFDPTDLAKAPYVVVEAAATKCLADNDNLLSAGWANFADPGGACTVALVVDPQYGNVYRITKTAGAAGVRVGVSHSAAGMAGTAYAAGAFIKRGGATCSGYAAYVDAAKVGGGLITQSVRFEASSDLAWRRYAVGSDTGANLAGSANFYVLLDSAIGDYIDVKLPEIELGTALTSPVAVPAGAAPFVRPADVVNPAGAFVYSNLAESDYPAWSSATAYVVGNRVMRGHHNYEAQQNSTNADPVTNSSGDTRKWLDLGATNQRACLDQIVAAASSGPDRLIFVFRPGKFTSALALLNVDANDVRVSMVDENGIVRYQQTQYLRIKKRTFTDWLFKPVERKRSAVFESLPFYSKGLITVTVTKIGGTPSVGEIVTGRTYEIGSLQWKPEIRGLRFSKIATDPDFGLVTFLKRPDAKEITCDLVVDNDAVEESTRVLDVYTTAPVVFFAGVGSNKFGGLLTALGFVSDYRTVLNSTAGSLINTKIQGFV